MKEAVLTINQPMAEMQNDLIQQTVRKERARLYNFIRQRVPADADAEDVLQDVFYELVETVRLMKPVEQVASWLFTVARNKITDRFRKHKPVLLEDQQIFAGNDEEKLFLADILPSDDTADGQMMRTLMTEAIEEALDELPEEQREVFVMHEIEDKSFKEIAEITGAPVNTLLSRKRYAILYLRSRLQDLYNELFN